MKKLSLLIILGLINSTLAFANPQLTSEFKTLVSEYRVGQLANQAYCYKQDNGQVDGYQTAKLMPIASVTKLFTSFFALELLNPNKTYTTKFYIQGDRLHIEGGLDPYFQDEKIFLLLAELNQRGYKQFKKVTFDKNFRFSDLSYGEYQEINPAHVASRLKIFLNTAANSAYLLEKFQEMKVFAKEEGVRLNLKTLPQMRVESLEVVAQNPLLGSSELSFSHESKPLHQIIKAMNVPSNNFIAQNLFDEASKVMDFKTFMAKKGFNTSLLNFYTGSGLTLRTAQGHVYNSTTCSVVLDLVSKLNQSIRSKGMEPQDLIAVNGGVDKGSFRERFLKFTGTHGAVISKTGTLSFVSALAGTLETNGGEISFAIINKDANDNVVARKFQDDFVDTMFRYLGNPSPVSYEKISIFPWDESAFLTEI